MIPQHSGGFEQPYSLKEPLHEDKRKPFVFHRPSSPPLCPLGKSFQEPASTAFEQALVMGPNQLHLAKGDRWRTSQATPNRHLDVIGFCSTNSFCPHLAPRKRQVGLPTPKPPKAGWAHNLHGSLGELTWRPIDTARTVRRFGTWPAVPNRSRRTGR